MQLRDLVAVVVSTGKIEPVALGKRVVTFQLSPDGSRVIYSRAKRFERPGSQQILYDLVTVDLSTMEEQAIASDIRLGVDGDFSWSPDGSKVSFRQYGMEERLNDCYVIDLKSHSTQNLTNVPSPQRDQSDLSARTFWDVSGKEIYFISNGALWGALLGGNKALEVVRIPDRRITGVISQFDNLLWTSDAGKTTVVLTYDESGGQSGFYKVDLKTGASTRLKEGRQCYGCAGPEDPVTVSKDGRHFVFLVEDAQHDSDAWMSDSSLGKLARVTHLNPHYDRYRMGDAQLVKWLSDDGEQLQGALLLPADFSPARRYPLVVFVYGGSRLSDLFKTFGMYGKGPFNMQLLATRGYAVLLPDAPVHVGTPMTDIAKAVLPGVNKLIEMGIADPVRLGVIGQSFGGYSTLALIVQTKRFRAAMMADGFGDIMSAYGAMRQNGAAYETSVMEQGQGRMGGTPWQFRERYIENSPIFYLDRIETPLFIVNGSADTVVPSFLGDQVFVGLRRLGKEVVYAKYDGEGHSVNGWKYANQLDFTRRMIAWFDKYLKPTQPTN